MTDAVSAYDQPPPHDVATAGDDVVVARMAYPPWEIGGERPTFPPGPHLANERFEAIELAPAPGVLQGLRYPLAPDLEGLHHLFTSFLTIEIRDATWPERARWLEVVGADVLVAPEPLEAQSLVLSAINKSYGARSFFFRVVDPAPEAFWPDALEVARSPLDAFALVARSPPGTLAGIVPQPIEHQPGGRVQVVAMAPDRIELDVESEGGVAVIRRAFQPLMRARIEGREIATVPVNLCQLGLLVPAGKHRVVVAVSSWPEIVAGGDRDGGGADTALDRYRHRSSWPCSPGVRCVHGRRRRRDDTGRVRRPRPSWRPIRDRSVVPIWSCSSSTRCAPTASAPMVTSDRSRPASTRSRPTPCCSSTPPRRRRGRGRRWSRSLPGSCRSSTAPTTGSIVSSRNTPPWPSGWPGLDTRMPHSSPTPTCRRASAWRRGSPSIARCCTGKSRGEPLVKAAIEWLDQRADPSRPFLLYLHIVEPHAPYRPPPDLVERFAPGPAPVADLPDGAFMKRLGSGEVAASPEIVDWMRDLYDGEVASADFAFASLVGELRVRGLYDSSIVVVTADHGEELFDHGGWEHGKTLFAEVLDVPLMVRLPGGARGRRVAAPVQQIDLMPTLLEAVGLEAPKGLHGRSLLPLLTGGAGGERDSARAASSSDAEVVSLLDLDGEHLESVTAGGWRLIRRRTANGSIEELYRLTEDPGETRNLAASEPETAARLGALLDEAGRAAPASPPEAIVVDPKLERELRALGYL